MTGVVHASEARQGGRFSMSLVYPEDGKAARGRTSATTHPFRGRFVPLVPDAQVASAVAFESADPSFAGEMTVRTSLASAGAGTRVTIVCESPPAGIRREDNEAGCRESLDKLAALLER